ncbi:hypothetical protein BgiBS90_015479, partial [Biomphalaria glabrata]
HPLSNLTRCIKVIKLIQCDLRPTNYPLPASSELSNQINICSVPFSSGMGTSAHKKNNSRVS